VCTLLGTRYSGDDERLNRETNEHARWCIRYSDKDYEYRHVQLPKAMLKIIPKEYMDGSRGTLKLLWEDEWRALGITQVSTDLYLTSPFYVPLAVFVPSFVSFFRV
jgi:hypothetical protein